MMVACRLYVASWSDRDVAVVKGERDRDLCRLDDHLAGDDGAGGRVAGALHEDHQGASGW